MPKLSLGQPAPTFTLPDLRGQPVALETFLGEPVLVNFWSAECPWAARADEPLAGLQDRVVLLSIASNANEPLELLSRVAAERGLARVLRDSDHQVADLYGAQTTPHLFLIDARGVLRYEGAFDDVTFRQRTPTRAYLQDALAALLAGAEIAPADTPPYGCTIVRFAE